MSDKLQFVGSLGVRPLHQPRQTEGSSDQVPRSGNRLQPRVAAAATLGIQFQRASTPMGLCPLALLFPT